MASPQKTAKGLRDLAKQTELSVNTLQGYLKRPGAPQKGEQGWDIVEVCKFISEATKSGRTLKKSSPEYSDAKLREIVLKCDKLQFELEVAKGKYILVEDAARESLRLASTAKSVLIAKFRNELPPVLEGLSAAKIQELCGTAITEVCEALSK